jgi:hypothetical protein
MLNFIKVISIIIISIYCINQSSATIIFGNTQSLFLKDLSQVERNVFGYSNSYYSDERRLDLLEKKLFGSIQKGTHSERLLAIKTALQNEEFIYSSPQTISKIKTRILNKNINRLTGYEPPALIPPTPRYHNKRTKIKPRFH